MVIRVAVRSFHGFSEDLLWAETFMSVARALKIAFVMNITTNMITITEVGEGSAVDTIMAVEEDLVEDMVVITN
jgi:hypothetical protein